MGYRMLQPTLIKLTSKIIHEITEYKDFPAFEPNHIPNPDSITIINPVQK